MSARPSLPARDGAVPAPGWRDRYEAVVRVVAAARLGTATKAFCSCAVDPDAEPNANTCPVCLGLPGTLPVLNVGAVERAARGALALGAGVQLVSGFSRDHRPPSPERPKGYVLTQCDRPLALRGGVQFGETTTGAPIAGAVRAAYLTEDVGRAVHGRFADATGMDYNLAGAPLLVVEGVADLRSPGEARAFVASLGGLLRDADASSADLAEGTLEATAYVAIRGRGDLEPGAATELRGFDSLDALEAGVAAECARHAATRDAGNTVESRRMLWDPATGTVLPARAAAPSSWRLVDPDLPPLLLTADWIAAQRDALPELAPDRRARLRRAYALDDASVDVLSADPTLTGYYESVARAHGDAPAAARWLEAQAFPLIAREGLTVRDLAVRVRPADLAWLLDLRRDGGVSEDAAERVFRTMVRTGLGVARAAEREGFVLPDRPGA